MTDLDDRVISEATDQGPLRAETLLALCERYAEGEPGVTQETVLAYARELADRDVALDPRSEELTGQETYTVSDGLLLRELQARRTDATDWEGDRIYVIDSSTNEADERLSAFPRSWYERIGGETDLQAIFEFLEANEPFRQHDTAGTGKVSPDRLVTVASVVGGLSPEEARDRLATLEDDGEIVRASEADGFEGLEARGADADTGLPPMLDFRNALDDIEAQADPEADVSEEVGTIRTQLQAFAERDDPSRESILSNIDRLTVDIESRTEGMATTRAQGIRNRIETFRESLRDGETGLSFSGATFQDANGNRLAVGESDGGLAALTGTLVNGGPDRAVVAMCAFYDESEQALQTVESRIYELDAGEQRDVRIDLFVPSAATRYATAALDATGSRAIGDAKPEPDRTEGNEQERAD